MRQSALPALIALLALVVAAGCTSSGVPAPIDAGSDAGSSRDAGTDAGVHSDAGTNSDAGNSTGSDGGTDAGLLAGDAGTHWAFLFGGHFETNTNTDPPSDYDGDFWSWNGEAWTELDAGSGPLSRSMAAAAPFRDGMLMYGGEGGDPDNNRTTLADGWLWSGAAWIPLASDSSDGGPEPVALVTGVRCNDSYVLYGGYDLTGSNRYDTWVFDGTSWTHFPAPSSNLEPVDGGPQSAFGVAAGTVNGTCYLIDSQGSMFTWSGSAWTAIAQGASAPPARSFASAAGLSDTLVLFGGVDALDGGTLGDTWIWNGTQWQQSSASGPPARSGAAMAPYGDTVLLFGGSQATSIDSAGVFLGDTWSWDGGAWTLVANSGPSPRAESAMAGQ